MMTKNEMQKLAYEKFKLWWIMSHGYCFKDLLSVFAEYMRDIVVNDEFVDFNEYLEARGFAGAVWPCFDEFIDCEYADPAVMYSILNPDEYIQYLQIEEQEKPHFFNQRIRVATENGVIEAYDNDNPDYPGITVAFTPNGQGFEGPGCVIEQGNDGKAQMSVFTLESQDEPAYIIPVEDDETTEDLKPATYISRWDGSIEIRSKCMVNMTTKNVYSIEVNSSVEGLDNLDGEFVEIDGCEYPVYEEDGYDLLAPEDQEDAYWRA